MKSTSDKLDVNVCRVTIRTSLHTVGKRKCSNVRVGGENNTADRTVATQCSEPMPPQSD